MPQVAGKSRGGILTHDDEDVQQWRLNFPLACDGLMIIAAEINIAGEIAHLNIFIGEGKLTEHSSRSIITSETGLTHSGPVESVSFISVYSS